MHAEVVWLRRENRIQATETETLKRAPARCSPATMSSQTGSTGSTREEMVYCCAVLDMYSRMTVVWSIADHMRAELVVDPLQMSCWRRQPPPRTFAAPSVQRPGSLPTTETKDTHPPGRPPRLWVSAVCGSDSWRSPA